MKPKRRPHFLAAWIRSPKSVGAIMPSSRGLARAMIGQIDPAVPGAIIELGAGTGSMTKAFLQAGLPVERLLVIERDPHLHALLTARFPGLHILCEDAMNLDKVLERHGVTQVCAIISSLPFLSMPKPIGHVIQSHMAQVIGDDGVIVQFTYGMHSPISKEQLEKCRLVARRGKTVVANLPPAHVWVYRRQA